MEFNMQKLILFALALLAAVITCAASAPRAQAAWDFFKGNNSVCNYTGTGNSSACNANGANPLIAPDGILPKATKLVARVAAAAAVVMMIAGGFLYVDSRRGRT